MELVPHTRPGREGGGREGREGGEKGGRGERREGGGREGREGGRRGGGEGREDERQSVKHNPSSKISPSPSSITYTYHFPG